MLHDVTKNDAGTYVCSKSNGFNATKNVTIFIEVLGMSLQLKCSLQRGVHQLFGQEIEKAVKVSAQF